MEPERETFSRLEGAVGRLLQEYAQMRERALLAETQARSLEELLSKYQTGTEEPGDLVARLRVAKLENQELRSRLEEGRNGVERLLAQIRFLEEQR
jgi:hypothetical protein